MNKKLFTLLLLVASSKSLFGMGSPCYYGRHAQIQVGAAYAAGNANSTAIQSINKKLESLELKDGSEVKELKKDLDETKKLLKETQSQMQTQNSLLLQHKNQVMDAIANFNQQAQKLVADSSKQLNEKDAELNQLKTKQQQESRVLTQLQETHKRIASSLALLEASKVTGWETAFVETLKTELKEPSQG